MKGNFKKKQLWILIELEIFYQAIYFCLALHLYAAAHRCKIVNKYTG
jgi:hypothetical protein